MLSLLSDTSYLLQILLSDISFYPVISHAEHFSYIHIYIVCISFQKEDHELVVFVDTSSIRKSSKTHP